MSMTIKKTMLLAAVALVAVAFAAPSMAAANWTDGGVEVNENREVKFEGNASFISSSLGGLTCTGSASKTKLLKNSKKGEVESFGVANLATCTLSGALSAVCSKVTGITAEELPWPAEVNAAGTAVNITVKKLHNTFSGGIFCTTTINLSGTAVATPDSTSAAKTATLSGTLAATNASGGSLGNVTAGDTLNVSPSGTYGIK